MAANTEFLADGPVGDDRPAPETVTPRVIALKLAAFGLLVAVVFAGLYVVSERVRPVYPRMADRVQHIEERGDAFEAVAVGSSHTGALDFSALGLDGLHLWRGGMDYYQANYILRAAARDLPNLRFVFVTTDVSSYADNLLAEPGEDRRRETYVFGARLRGPGYLRFLSDGIDGVENDWKTLLQARFWPIARPDSWEGVYDRLRDPSLAAYPRTPDGTVAEISRERITADSVAAHAEQVAEVRLEQRFALLDARPDICQVGRALMDRIADATGPETITVFYTHTAFPNYVDRFEALNRRPDGRADCTPPAYAEELDRKRDDVLYIDLRYYPPVSDHPSEHYFNGDHLSREGAYVFSAGLREHLAERLREDGPRGPARDLLLAREPPPTPTPPADGR